MLHQKISEAINTCEPTVEVGEDIHARLGAQCDYFHAFFLCSGELYSLNVRYEEVPRNGWYFLESHNYCRNEIYLNHFCRHGGQVEKTEESFIAEGIDPRVVSDGEQAYGIITGFRKPGWGMLLYDFRRQRLIPIVFKSEALDVGKNWQPYLVHGELFAVQEMAPFRVLKIDRQSGAAEIIEERDQGFNLYAFYGHYPMFRGGANAIARNGEIAGFGRTTSQQYRHQPYLWSVRNNGPLKAEFSTFFHAFNRRGYNIIDPTCLFLDGEDVMLGVCCTERDWAHDQNVTNLLLRFPSSASRPQGLALSEFLATKPATESMRRPILDRHMFFCLDLPCAVASRAEHGGRVSTGPAGHLVHGPYVRIEKEGHYCAELSYLTRECPGQIAGNVEVTVCRTDENRRQTEFRTLAQVDLPATGGEMREARVQFDTTGLEGMLLETRVYVAEGVVLNAFHIRTRRFSCPQ
jgi:hypothetical protein